VSGGFNLENEPIISDCKGCQKSVNRKQKYCKNKSGTVFWNTTYIVLHKHRLPWMAQQYLLPHGGSHHIVEQKITPKALI